MPTKHIEITTNLSKLRPTYRSYGQRVSDPVLRRLYESIECARIFNTKYLLDNSSLNLNGHSGRIALSIVCRLPDEKQKIRLQILDLLIEKGCDYNLQDEHGMTLISWICKAHKMDLLKYMLDKNKMDIKYDVTDENNDTTLMHAVRTGDLEFTRLVLDTLVQFGINVDIRNDHGFTPYAEAVRLKLDNIAELLVHVGEASTAVSTEPCTNNPHNFKTTLLRSIRRHMPTKETVEKMTFQNLKYKPKNPAIESERNLSCLGQNLSCLGQKTSEIVCSSSISNKCSPGFKTENVSRPFSVHDIESCDSVDLPSQLIVPTQGQSPELCRRKSSPAALTKMSQSLKVSSQTDQKSKPTATLHNGYLERIESFKKQPSKKFGEVSNARRKSIVVTSPRVEQELKAFLKTATHEKLDDVFNTGEEYPTILMEPSRHNGKLSRRCSLQVKSPKRSRSRASSIGSFIEDVNEERLYYQNKIDDLMQYSMKPPRFHETITYADLREMYDKRTTSSGRTSSFCDVSWLLLMKEEQRKDSFLGTAKEHKQLKIADCPGNRTKKGSIASSTITLESSVCIPRISNKKRVGLTTAVMNRLLANR